MGKVGTVFHPAYLRHDTGPGHPERADRLRALIRMLEASKLKDRCVAIPAREATESEIASVHDSHYIHRVAKTAEIQGQFLDPDTVASPQSYQAALLAAGGLLEAVDRVMNAEMNHAFAMVRPPGHHAERDRAMGFCFFNNVGIAAQYLLDRYGLKRVAVVDFDVHHGNATQHMFYDRSDVFYLSTHRYPFFPGTGSAEEKGRGAGLGYTLNFPMSGGCGDAEYDQIFSAKLIPALRDYRPEFILVSAGFDAHRLDPLGGMQVTSQGFAEMVKKLEAVGQEFCGGKMVYTLEGGYDLVGLSESVKEVLKVLLTQS